ncbi:hypothetical protein MSIMFI_05552 [Mycobacterium simulans]|nr:hypothetical protein MSIMFI_05552 [Mycobacterium simulans]
MFGGDAGQHRSQLLDVAGVTGGDADLGAKPRQPLMEVGGPGCVHAAAGHQQQGPNTVVSDQMLGKYPA